MKDWSVVISCEHGGREVPLPYAALFEGRDEWLQSHRGWDPGALELGTEMAEAVGAPLYASTTTRLLIDLNRSLGHRQLYSEVTRALPRGERERIAAAHYRPHRDAIENEVAERIAQGQRIVHIASHSFTPVLDGNVRRADVAWLYDPRRAGEAALTRRWIAQFAHRDPALMLRRNYPYRGRGDGLNTLLRKRYGDEIYIGIEVEVNQRFVAQGGDAWKALRVNLIESFRGVLA